MKENPILNHALLMSSGAGTYMKIQSGVIPFTAARQECVDIIVTGRQSYSKFNIQFGCQRGGYTEECPSEPGSPSSCASKATCDEVSPKGIDQACKSSLDVITGDESINAFSAFVLDGTEYDEGNNVTKYTYL